MQCACSARVVHMQCTCGAHAVRMQCTCGARVLQAPLHVRCTCQAHPAVHQNGPTALPLGRGLTSAYRCLPVCSNALACDMEVADGDATSGKTMDACDTTAGDPARSKLPCSHPPLWRPSCLPGVPVSLSACHYHALSREHTAYATTSLSRVRARSQPGIASGYSLGTYGCSLGTYGCRRLAHQGRRRHAGHRR